MKWLTLNDIKDQLRIDRSYTDEDDVLKSYGESAEETVLNVLNRTYFDVIENYGAVPESIVNASKLLVDLSYQHRSPITVGNLSMVPYSLEFMLKPYMVLAGGTTEDVQTVTLGSDVKIEFTATLPDEMTLYDVDFTGKIINADKKEVDVDFAKADCIRVIPKNSYVVLVDTTHLGIGTLMLKLTVQIPDTDFASGYRKEIVNINPHIRIKG